MVLKHLEDLIAAGNMTSGDRLPTERALEKALAASRTDVRRALTQLAIDGRVVRHVGRGTFLAEQRDPGHAQDPTSASPTELMAARLLFEPRVVSMAAMTATMSDLEELQRCLDGGDGTSVYEEFEAWDMALHRNLALATHNTVVVAAVDTLLSSRNGPVWGTSKRRTFTVERCLEYRADHHKIVDALRDRDAAAAEAAMVKHLEHIERVILSPMGTPDSST